MAAILGMQTNTLSEEGPIALLHQASMSGPTNFWFIVIVDSRKIEAGGASVKRKRIGWIYS
jgi:hypothetical protein